ATRRVSGDLSVFDSARVPQWLEQPVAEAERQKILHRFLAEIVIYPERSLLREGIQNGVIDPAERGKVLAQRFLKSDSCLFPGQSHGLKPGDGRLKQRGSGGK